MKMLRLMLTVAATAMIVSGIEVALLHKAEQPWVMENGSAIQQCQSHMHIGGFVRQVEMV